MCLLTIRPLLERSRSAARAVRTLPSSRRDRSIEAIASAIEDARDEILAANALDMADGAALSSALQDRLRLDSTRLESLGSALRAVAAQDDPLGATRSLGQGPSGIRVTRRAVPLGVIAIVYEARPNVTAECAALTMKSGNAVILRGGKEALRSNRAIFEAIQAGLLASDFPPDAVQLVQSTDREVVRELLAATGYVDLAIPRGGHRLMEMVDTLARVPVVRHGQGICHIYIDREADLAMATEIAHNAKVNRPGVCNAMETLLVHEAVAPELLGSLGGKFRAAGVALRGDEAATRIWSQAGIEAQRATAEDWDTEFLRLELAVRVVASMEDAMSHIEAHGTHHTAAIVTGAADRAERFLSGVDASCVLWNASTRFNDGGELGLGAEMGISTSKMHAYGPMSATELTTEKLVVYGAGQVRG